MVEVDRDNDDNDEYVYYLLMEVAPERIRLWNGGWGWVVGRYMGYNSLFYLYYIILLCRLNQESWGTAQVFQEGWKLNNIHNRLLKV